MAYVVNEKINKEIENAFRKEFKMRNIWAGDFGVYLDNNGYKNKVQYKVVFRYGARLRLTAWFIEEPEMNDMGIYNTHIIVRAHKLHKEGGKIYCNLVDDALGVYKKENIAGTRGDVVKAAAEIIPQLAKMKAAGWKKLAK